MLELTFRESFTTNVKKNINKLKAQAQAIMSTDEITPMTPDEELEEDDNSEEEEEEVEKSFESCCKYNSEIRSYMDKAAVMDCSYSDV